MSRKIITYIIDVAKVWMHEYRQIFKDEGTLLFVILVPLLYPVLYSWIYNNEVVKEVPVAVVDCSHSAMAREFVRHCDASSDVKVAYRCNSLEEAKDLVAHQKVYGVIYMPEDFGTRLGRMEQAHVSVYCNMGLMLTYKAIFQTCTAVAADLNSRIQIELSGAYTAREGEITASPINVRDVPMFNNTGGYGNFILPGVLVLVLQQVLLLGIGMAYGTSYEKHGFVRLKPMLPCALRDVVGLGVVGNTAHLQLRAHNASRRVSALHHTVSSRLHLLRHNLLVHSKAARECHAPRGIYVCALPLHVGRVVA